MKTVDQLFDERAYTVEDMAERSGLTVERVEAIALGRWTPSPRERQAMADALEITIDEVSWGHTMDPRNIRYRQRGLHEKF